MRRRRSEETLIRIRLIPFLAFGNSVDVRGEREALEVLAVSGWGRGVQVMLSVEGVL